MTDTENEKPIQIVTVKTSDGEEVTVREPILAEWTSKRVGPYEVFGYITKTKDVHGIEERFFPATAVIYVYLREVPR